MSGRMLLAASITALGAVITLVNLRDGLNFSFPLLLGVLLLADGFLRFAMLDRDTPDPADDEHERARTASDRLDRTSPIGPITAHEGFARDDVPELRSLPDQRDSTPRPE